jgi:hypothetical protein
VVLWSSLKTLYATSSPSESDSASVRNGSPPLKLYGPVPLVAVSSPQLFINLGIFSIPTKAAAKAHGCVHQASAPRRHATLAHGLVKKRVSRPACDASEAVAVIKIVQHCCRSVVAVDMK